jgi:hypothetical protein
VPASEEGISMADSKSAFIREAKHYKFLLDEDFIMTIPELKLNAPLISKFVQLIDGQLTLFLAYAWDGSSVPGKKWYRWAWDADKFCKIASLIHDGLCQLIREELLPMRYKEQVDEIYRVLCIRGGMGEKEANIRYECLRKFGDSFVKPKPNTDKGKVIEVKL